jgi:CRISPR-associated protein Cas2
MYTYLACYDIKQNRTRRYIAKTLESYGKRIQESVFEVCFNKKSEVTKLRKRLVNKLEEEDDLRFYFISYDSFRHSQMKDGSNIKPNLPYLVI